MAGMLSASSSLQSLKDGAPCLVSPGPGSSRLHFPSPLSESPGSSSPGEMTLGADTSSNLSSPASQTPIAQGSSSGAVSSPRPSSLHGLKHKLHIKTKNLHSPSRRKSVGHIPLSPLARTPSPGPLPPPISPTRTPSPLALPLAGHQPGSSNATQTFSPGSHPANLSSSGLTPNKKSFSRPKSTDPGPGSPLLRRALSPDRLHPRSAEVCGGSGVSSSVSGRSKAASISPLCSPPIKPGPSTSPLPSRATHSSPGTAQLQEAGQQLQLGSSHRKHSSKSLGQPTIPEEGPDQQEDPVPTPAPSSLQAKEGAKVTKSGSAKETEAVSSKGPAKEEVRLKAGSDSSASSVKSPKLSRTESMTERTVQKISKMVRGTSRSESRSKKTREPSSSPTLAPDHSQEKEKETEKTRSAQEKRDMFKSKKDP